MQEAYMLAPTERSMPAISRTKVMPIAMIGDVRRLGEDVEEVGRRQEVRRQAGEDGDQDKEEEQRGVLQEEQPRSRGTRAPHSTSSFTPSHMAERSSASRSKPARSKKPRTSPWLITMTRSHMPISSSISEEIIRMPAPSDARRLISL